VAEFQLKSSAIFSASAAATLLLVGSQAKAQNDGARWSRTSQGAAPVRRAVVAQSQQQSVSMMPQRAPFPYSRRSRPVFPGQRTDGSQQQQFRATTGAPTRRGIATQPQQTYFVPEPVFQPFPRPVAFTLLPAILLSDGTVLANFGFGFEPVSRFCGNQFVIAGNQQTIATGSFSATQPSPNQATESAQMLPSAQRFPVLTTASLSSCWTRDSFGQFFVVR